MGRNTKGKHKILLKNNVNTFCNYVVNTVTKRMILEIHFKILRV